MKQFRYGFIHHLKKEEFAALMQQIINKRSLQEVEDLSVREAYERLAANEESLHEILALPRKHPLTDKINIRTKERQLLLRSLQYSIKAKLHSADRQEREAADKLSYLFKAYQGKFYHPKLSSHSNSVQELKAAIYGERNYLAQMETLQLVEQFELIEKLTDEIDKMQVKRLDYRADTKRLTKRVREEMQDNLQLLLSTLLIAAKLNSENEVYQTLIFQIEDILKERERVLHIRQGMRRGRKAREAEKRGE